MRYQQGIGLVEVLVALVLLAIAILGFTALQLRAVGSSLEAGNNVQAVGLARDLAERMRANPEGLSVFRTSNGYTTANTTINCSTAMCTPANMARYDFAQVAAQAASLGMDIAVRDCQGYTNYTKRSCIYVAWDSTRATNGTGDSDCTNGTSYNKNAKCVILEAYNYE